MSLKLKLTIIVLIFVGLVAYIFYNHFGNQERRELNRKVAKLARMVNESQRWYLAEYGKIEKQMDQSQRGKLTAKLNRELRARLDKIGSFKDEIASSYEKMQNMPNTYKSIDETIQKMKKEAGMK
jgi:hypothetical protein